MPLLGTVSSNAELTGRRMGNFDQRHPSEEAIAEGQNADSVNVNGSSGSVQGFFGVPVVKYFGIKACVSHDIECAARLRGMLQADEVTNGLLRFPIANPFGLVCFTAIPPSLNAKILGEVGSSGFMIYPSELIDGTPIIRVASGRGPCVTQAVYQLKEATLTIGMRRETQFKFQATTFIQVRTSMYALEFHLCVKV
ncbi:hypothetical protein FOZ60_007336 [Perkinsus olseni]|uniref:Uncharacterized protein n=1 Tax=Perkinsus olseni TaxID=32597 RepID=A0A7J6NLQ3_PEROL|nr:hypothetical protein FOZ60_007336 [Perkinsus olseni]